ncbi:hypothetical protein OC861_002233 [Tilletia horrida]|nr:hypothetical protein OC845_000914 [Tilletia horrida]KAK0568142.1 hypothetical protein OC861_002233 [Tilletia horrida]
MALGNDQKRASRGTGLKRLSLLRGVTSTASPSTNSKKSTFPAPVSGPAVGPTSYTLPDRSRAREFIHRVSSSTSSSEYSLSVALAPPAPSSQRSPPEPVQIEPSAWAKDRNYFVSAREVSALTPSHAPTQQTLVEEDETEDLEPDLQSEIERTMALMATLGDGPYPDINAERRRSMRAAPKTINVPLAVPNRHNTPQKSRVARRPNTPMSTHSTVSDTLSQNTITQLAINYSSNLSSKASTGSMRSVNSAKPMLTEMVAPRRPPRSSKRKSMMWPQQPVPTLPITTATTSSFGRPAEEIAQPAASTPPSLQRTSRESQRPSISGSSYPARSDASASPRTRLQDKMVKDASPKPKAAIESPHTGFQSNRSVYDEPLQSVSYEKKSGFQRHEPSTPRRFPNSTRTSFETMPFPPPAPPPSALAATEDGSGNSSMEARDGFFSDLEIVAMTDSDSCGTPSYVEEGTPSTTEKDPLQQIRDTQAARQSIRKSIDRGMAPTSCSVRSLVEVLAECEGSRSHADAQWEMLTGTKDVRASIKVAKGRSSLVEDQEHQLAAGTSSLEQPRIGTQDCDAVVDRADAMKAVEMWRLLAESYEMGDFTNAEVVETGPTPASSVILADDVDRLDDFSRPSSVVPSQQGGQSPEVDVIQQMGLFPGVPQVLTESGMGTQLQTEPERSLPQSVSALVFRNSHVSPPSSLPDQPDTDDLATPAATFGDACTDSNPSTFNTPMPGGFSSQFSPKVAKVSRYHQQEFGDVSSGSTVQSSTDPSFDSSHLGLGLVFSADHVTPPSSHGHTSVNTLSEQDSEEDLQQKAPFKSDVQDTSASFAAETASLTASDSFQSANEDFDISVHSRQTTHEDSEDTPSRSGSPSPSSVKLERHSSINDHEEGEVVETITPNQAEDSPVAVTDTPSSITTDDPPVVVTDTSLADSCDATKVEDSEVGETTLDRPASSCDDRPTPSEKGEFQHMDSDNLSTAATMTTLTFDKALVAPRRQPRFRPPLAARHPRNAPAIIPDSSPSKEAPQITQPVARTQPLPQKAWTPSIEQDGACSEPETPAVEVATTAREERRRSTMTRSRNSILGAEARDAEVMSARRASKRFSKLGLIDMSSSRVVEKRKSITARQRLTAFMNATPIILVEPPAQNSWRSKVSTAVFEDLLHRWGPQEMHRQEVLWELCETERSFVQAICSVQKIFALPLRTPEGRWIRGVPTAVARLFDWLEDIFQLHCRIHATLQRARQQQTPILVQIAEELLRCVPKLEVHQPYLVRFEAVTQAIEEMLRSDSSVFGQFIKMQMQIPECNSMSFSSFLLKPVQRLMKYPLFFKQLAELTPAGHPDHHATQALLSTTDQVIRDMNDVKAREEDYRDLKALQGRIKGLPEGFQLATRERRLLRQGHISCVQLGLKEKLQLGLAVSPGDGLQMASASLPNTPLMGHRASMMMAGPKDMDSSAFSRARAANTESVCSSSSTVSPTSVTSNTYEWEAYLAMDTAHRNGRPRSFISTNSLCSESSASLSALSHSMQTRDSSDRLASHLAKAPMRKNSVANMLLRKEKPKEKDTLLQAFVFSDMVVLAHPSEACLKARQGKKGKTGSTPIDRGTKSGNSGLSNSFELLERVGLSRILKVTDHSGKCSERPHLLELELLPLKIDSTYSNSFDKRNAGTGPATLFISFQPTQEASPSISKTPEQDSVVWFRALQRSFLWSLRSRKRNSLMYSSKRESMISLGSGSFKPQPPNAHADWPRRAQQVTDLVMAAARSGDAENLASLIQAGLPFPKSPSQQDLATFAGEELRSAHVRLFGSDSSLSGPTGEASHIPVVGFGILDETEEEKEERRWWALRLTEVRQAAEAEREIDAMVERLHSDLPRSSSSADSNSHSTSYHNMHNIAPAVGARRKVRQGLPVLKSS